MAYAALERLQQSSKLVRAWRESLDDVVMGMAAGGKMLSESEDWNAVASLATETY